MNIALEYIKYRLNAKGRHGIHSPFVYDLLDKCMKTRVSTEDATTLRKVKKLLKNDNRIIQVEDFGVGSKKLGNQRRVKQLFKTNSSNGKFGRLIYQITNYYEPQYILEFGTSIGVGAMHFALGCKSCKVTTVEACKETYGIAISNFAVHHMNNIIAINKSFEEYLSSNPSEMFDVIFIDGHHDGKALCDYLEKLRPNYHDQTIILIDDIRWSDSMFNAWNKISSSQEFHVSIDLFRMGIVVPRKGQMKEHFKIGF